MPGETVATVAVPTAGSGGVWPSSPEGIATLGERFRLRRHIHLPGLISARRAACLEAAIRGLAARRVNCRDGANRWDEQEIAAGELHAFFRDPGGVRFLRTLLATEAPLERLVCWTSRYALGEFINLHRDASGTVQVLLCLAACPAANGGALVLGDPPEERLHLRPGDAVVFEATTVDHRTTPLRATAEVPSPRRVVAVGRYFFARDVPGGSVQELTSP